MIGALLRGRLWTGVLTVSPVLSSLLNFSRYICSLSLTSLSQSHLHLEISHRCQLARCNDIPQDQSLLHPCSSNQRLAGLLANELIVLRREVFILTRVTTVLARGSEVLLSRWSWLPRFEGWVCLVHWVSRNVMIMCLQDWLVVQKGYQDIQYSDVRVR